MTHSQTAWSLCFQSSLHWCTTFGSRETSSLFSWSCFQVLYALFSRPSTFRGRRGLWFIDNTAALMALIRGRSDNADLEYMSRLIHVTLFALQAWFFLGVDPQQGHLVRRDQQGRPSGNMAQTPWVHHAFLHFSPSRFGLYHFPRFSGLWSFSECFGIEVHWERFNLCSLLSFTGVRSRVYGSNQCCCAGGYLHSVPKHYPARSRLRPHEETGKEKAMRM